jgi:hypothetical protein
MATGMTVEPVIKGPFGINSIFAFTIFYHSKSKILFVVFLTCLMASDAPLDIFEIITAGLPYTLAGYMKTECRISALSGAAYYQELINSDNPAKFREIARMSRSTFKNLLDLLTRNGLKEGKAVKAGENLMILLYTYSLDTPTDKHKNDSSMVGKLSVG